MNKKSKSYAAGCGIGSLGTTLTTVLAVLKVFDLINISWWWVFSPVLISIGLSLVFILAAIIILFITSRS